MSRYGGRGVILDVTELDVLDSFATRTLHAIAAMSRRSGAETVIMGLQPDIALAMVQLGVTLEDLPTVRSLEEGLALLNEWLETSHGSG